MNKIKEFLFFLWLDKKKRIALCSFSIICLFSVAVLLFFVFRSPEKPDGERKYFETQESDVTEDAILPEKKVQSRGIDVSKWQGAIDWHAVSETGVDFAIIRLGYRAEDGVIYEDEAAVYNLQNAQKHGILTGVYFFSGATLPQEAKEEAQWVLERIQGFSISYPVVFDCEIGERNSSVSAAVRTDTALSFLSEIQRAGYEAMLYAPMGEFENESLWEAKRILASFPVWIARFSEKAYPQVQYPESDVDYAMWQYTDRGEIDGIRGEVDLNVSYFLRTYAQPKDPEKTLPEVPAPEDFLQTFSPVSKNLTAKEEVNLRSLPSIEGEVVGVLTKGEFLPCTGHSDMGWSRLTYNGTSVYAVASYLTDAVTSDPDPVPGHTFQRVNESVTAKNEVNLRKSPVDGEIVGTLKNGEFLTRTGIGDKGWDRLDLDGQAVYALASYLTTGAEGENNVPVQTFSRTNELVTAKIEVNLRSTPSTDGEVVGSLKNGEYLTCTGIGDKGWSRLEYNGGVVYAVTSYLQTAENS